MEQDNIKKKSIGSYRVFIRKNEYADGYSCVVHGDNCYSSYSLSELSLSVVRDCIKHAKTPPELRKTIKILE